MSTTYDEPDPADDLAAEWAERAGGAPETSWWRRARGRCGWCGRPLPREGRHRA